MKPAESHALLAFLYEHVGQPEHTCRLRWRPHTIAMWDNRCTQHHVLNDFEGERVIQRVTVGGDEPKGEGAPRWEPFIKTFSAASWRDEPLRKFLQDR